MAMTTNRCDSLPRDGLSRHSFWATAEVLRGLSRGAALRDLDRCSSLAGAINFQPLAFSLQHCLFGALTPAEIQIVEGAAK